MKSKIKLLSFAMLLTLVSQAQVKIGSNPLTITPGVNLEIEATDGSKVVFAQDTTAVGIGTNAPTNTLHVVGPGNPLRVEGLDGTNDVSNLTLVVDDNGVVRKSSISRLICLASFKKSTVDYMGPTNEITIKTLNFDTVLLDKTNSFDPSTGIFTAPFPGWYLVSVKLTTRPIGVVEGNPIRVGVSAPNQVDFASGNASFYVFAQKNVESTRSNVPNFNSAAGYMYLTTGDKIRAGSRYYVPTVNTLNVEAINYNRVFVTQFSVEYIGE